MKDAYTEYIYKGIPYRLVFNINTMEDIQNKFGSMGEWMAQTTFESGEMNIKAVKYGFLAMTNEGISIENDENGTDKPYISDRQAGRIMTELGLAKVGELLNEIVIKSSPDAKKNLKNAKSVQKKK